MKRSHQVASFDSMMGMLRALGGFLRGRDDIASGIVPTSLAPMLAAPAGLLNALPDWLKERIYARSGWWEAVHPHQLKDVRAEKLSSFILQHYPRRRYPAVMVGAASGALVHLAAAMQIPWLPQTLLIPVRTGSTIPPDDPAAALEWGREPGRLLLEHNPELQLHHMHDPCQDRLMVEHMAYFRVKRRTLGAAFTRFIEDQLMPGGTIYVMDCTRTWPTTHVDRRHCFQFGALGGATEQDFFHGSPRVADFLARYRSDRRAWEPPAPDARRPEAEWGFEPALMDDVEQLSRRGGYRLRRFTFQEPDDLSPFVADLYRAWYRQRNMPAMRLLVESFILLNPYWALRTGSVPLWMKFNTEASLNLLRSYLDDVEPFDHIHLMLFAHGTESIGLPPVAHWQSLLRRAKQEGAFLGVDGRAHPKDFGAFVRHDSELQKIPARYPLPGPLSEDELDAFVEWSGQRYAVRLEELRPSRVFRPLRRLLPVRS